MPELEKAERRAFVKIADARDAAGELKSLADLEERFAQDPLVLDGLRRRPRYFDGRFLTGADLTRDQDYVRQRQADMARAGGAGVISGLQVSERSLDRGETLLIEPGMGLTGAGDLVMISHRRRVPLLDLPTSRQLDVALGLADAPRVPLGRRSGLFLLALRPVEFTANPIAAYPRTISGQRTVEDGDIIEASAITLISYDDMGGASDLMDARRMVAKSIFGGNGEAFPPSALPLAMLALDRGTVRWIDNSMVRRETSEDSGLHVGVTRRPRALAEAFLQQHSSHLDDVLESLADRGLDGGFPAATQFSLLPPAGQMPAAALEADEFGFTQAYFPDGIDADLAFVPADEIPTLVDEALTLPPVDVDAGREELDGLAVTICIPVDRTRFRRIRGMIDADRLPLGNDTASSTSESFDLVSDMLERRSRVASASAAVEVSDEMAEMRLLAWRSALSEAMAALPAGPGGSRLVWYVRRRSVALQAGVDNNAITLSGDDVTLSTIVNHKIDRLKLDRRLAKINGDATPQAAARLMALLANPGIAASDILTAAVIADVERVISADLPELPSLSTIDADTSIARSLDIQNLRREELAKARAARLGLPKTLVNRAGASKELMATRAGLKRLAIAEKAGLSTKSRADTSFRLGEGEVMDVAQDYADANLSKGLTRLSQALGNNWPTIKAAVWLGETGKALDLDLAFRSVPEESVADFASLVKAAATKQDTDEIDAVLGKIGQ
ncbi:MAG: hypothetical protein AAF583_00535 [Pseudomonadota bacterium]